MQGFCGILPKTTICVDCFKQHPNVSLYFLSHFHSDHYQGLSSHWRGGTIYCTEVTRALLLHKFNLLPTSVVTLDILETKCLRINGAETVNVTAYPANHCPGSVMYLFEGTFGRYIYTGDLRFAPSMKQFSIPTGIDRMFLDTTFCAPQWIFPTKEDSIKQVVQLISDSNPNVKVYLECGTEAVLAAVSSEFGAQIYVDKAKFAELSNIPDLAQHLTTDPTATRFHACRHMTLSTSASTDLLHLVASYQYKAKARRNQIRKSWHNPEKQKEGEEEVLCIKPSVQWFRAQGVAAPAQYFNQPAKVGGVWHVMYSIHSSFPELVSFVDWLAPKAITPITAIDRTGFGKLLDLTHANALYFNDKAEPENNYKITTNNNESATSTMTKREDTQNAPFSTRSRTPKRAKFYEPLPSQTDVLETLIDEYMATPQSNSENLQGQKTNEDNENQGKQLTTTHQVDDFNASQWPMDFSNYFSRGCDDYAEQTTEITTTTESIPSAQVNEDFCDAPTQDSGSPAVKQRTASSPKNNSAGPTSSPQHKPASTPNTTAPTKSSTTNASNTSTRSTCSLPVLNSSKMPKPIPIARPAIAQSTTLKRTRESSPVPIYIVDSDSDTTDDENDPNRTPEIIDCDASPPVSPKAKEPKAKPNPTITELTSTPEKQITPNETATTTLTSESLFKETAGSFDWDAEFDFSGEQLNTSTTSKDPPHSPTGDGDASSPSPTTKDNSPTRDDDGLDTTHRSPVSSDEEVTEGSKGTAKSNSAAKFQFFFPKWTFQ